MLDIVGWIGSIAFAVCSLPQAWKSFQEKHSDGLSWGFLILWSIGEVFTIIYVLPTRNYPLLFNYFCNSTLLAIIIFYKFFPKRK